jgi:hypothetical protein
MARGNDRGDYPDHDYGLFAVFAGPVVSTDRPGGMTGACRGARRVQAQRCTGVAAEALTLRS